MARVGSQNHRGKRNDLFASGVYNAMEAALKKIKVVDLLFELFKKYRVLHSNLQLKIKKPDHEEACGPSRYSHVKKYGLWFGECPYTCIHKLM